MSPLLAGLRALLSLRRARLSLALCAAAGLALGANTLTNHVGYGACLVLALLGSITGAWTASGLPIALRRREIELTGGELAAAAVLAGVAPVALALALVLSRALAGPTCSPGTGAVAALLIALPGPALASLVGAGAGGLSRRRGVGSALALALVPAFVLWSLARFYTSPTIFAYDPFYGFFPGAIYDEDVPLGATLLSYRAGTLGWIVAAAAALVGAWDGARLRWAAARERPLALGLSTLGAALGVGVFLAGPALGHRHSASDIATALGGVAWSRRCVVRHDRSIPRRHALLTAQDCDVRVGQLEDFYGARGPRRITVFLFASASQKQSLMGAAHTYIAKPWRAEVYLQHAPFPHPVLKHELAHVVAGAMAPGPLQVTARGRLLPVPGLIEGAAVAGAWEGDGDSTPHQWSRAMLEAGITPRVSALNSLGFFAAASATAYTAAGSFCRWLHQSYGAARFRAVYASADFERVYGRDLAALEREWHTFLRTVSAPDALVARARARFFRASIFGRSCPFDLEALERRAYDDLSAGDLDAADAGLRGLLRMDPSSLRARVGRGVVLARRRDLDGANALIADTARVAGPAAAQRIRIAVADALSRWSPTDPATGRATDDLALRVLREADPRLMSEDEARTHDVKLEALTRGGRHEALMRTLLVGDGELDPSALAAFASAFDPPFDGPAPTMLYLAGRHLTLHERYGEAERPLRRYVQLGEGRGDGSARRVVAEAKRLLAVAWFHRGDLSRAARVLRELADDPSRPEGARDDARDWLDRIRRMGSP